VPEIRDLSADELQRETRLYRFLHQVNVVTDTAKRLQEKGDDLGVTMKAEEGGPLQMELRTPHLQTSMELAVVIEPVVRTTSDIHYSAILETCRVAKPSPEIEAFIAKATRAADRINQGKMQLNINGETQTPEWIYGRFMDKMVNAGDIEARDYEKNLDHDPVMRDLLVFQFYDYCMNMIRFLAWLRDTLKVGKFLPEGAPRDFLCIVCRRTGDEVSFTKAEHTLPEALGNTHSILPRGYYCDECQDLIAPTEAKVVDAIPFAMTRLWFVKHTKAGKFPSSKLGAVRYSKTKPNHIQMDIFAGKKAFPETTSIGDGKVNLRLTGKSKFDHVALGRMLVKAALGAMTIELGRAYVLHSRFDAAREFVRTGKGLHVRLVVGKKTSPNPQMAVEWHELTNGGVGVVMLVHGIEFAFAATPVPDETPPPPEILEKVEVFDLWNPSPIPHYKAGSAPSECWRDIHAADGLHRLWDEGSARNSSVRPGGNA
jgi:hypothetical protein